MSRCNAIRKMLVLHSEGILAPAKEREVERHLVSCAQCSGEAAKIGTIRGWLNDPELFEPMQDVHWQLLPERMAARAKLLPDRKERRFRWNAPKWALSAAVILAVACGLVWTLRTYSPAPPAAQPAAIAVGNPAFLKKMRTAYARAATAEYLTGCQALLIDLVSTETNCGGDRYDVSLEVARARELLQEKRILDAQLRLPEIVHVRNLCDELEHFLTNLSLLQKCESEREVQSLERYIDKEQLLFRINLIQAGIS